VPSIAEPGAGEPFSRQLVLGDVMSILSASATPEAASREEFLDILLADEDLLRADSTRSSPTPGLTPRTQHRRPHRVAGARPRRAGAHLGPRSDQARRRGHGNAHLRRARPEHIGRGDRNTETDSDRGGRWMARIPQAAPIAHP
jgi:hypothetical protein